MLGGTLRQHMGGRRGSLTPHKVCVGTRYFVSEWAPIAVWINRHWNEDNLGLDQIAHDALFTSNVFSSGGVLLTIPHEILLFTSLKMRLRSGRDGFNYIIRGCEIRRWYGWGNHDIATNGGVCTWGGCMRRGIRVNIKRKVERSGTLVTYNQVRFLNLNLGGW